jgi:hypothetical protein
MKKGETPASVTELPERPLECFGAFAAGNTMVLAAVGLTVEEKEPVANDERKSNHAD